MILHPEILAMLVSSALVTGMLLYASWTAVAIVRHWDIQSGSELQLKLERKTYLISTIVSHVFVLQIVSLFLFIHTAENLHSMFVGAMCAAGTLNVNAYGYPALIMKIATSLLAGVWLIVNYTDNKGYDYPLIRKKYAFLLVIAPLLVVETTMQTGFFTGLQADVITSCCGSLFSVNAKGVASELAGLPSSPMMAVFYACMALTIGSGLFFYIKRKGGYLFSSFGFAAFTVSLMSVVSFISLYIYELPTHHCPFCILQKDYNFIGYPMYASLFVAAVSGVGVGVILPFRGVESLKEFMPSILERLTLVSVALYFYFTATVSYKLYFTDFILGVFPR